MTSSMVFAWLMASCGPNAESPTAYDASGQQKSTPLFTLLSPDSTGVLFSNDLAPDDSLNILSFNYFFNGGGVAIGDVNNDQLPDIFFTGNKTSCRLYINEGNLKFSDVTESAGVSTDGWASGVSMVDINQDGWLDIYVCFTAYQTPGRRRNKLFINNGSNTFSEEAEKYGIADDGYATQAAFFDFDKDNDLDLYLANVYQDKLNPNLPRPKVSNGTSKDRDKLYRNNSNGTFTDISKVAGILHEGYGLGLVVSDLDNDGWPDIYVANDFAFDDVLYINNRDGTFSEDAANRLRHTSRFSMGIDANDFNNDGLTDIFVADMLPDDNRRHKLMNFAMNYDLFNLALERGYMPQYPRNVLQLNNGSGTYSEIGFLAGVARTDWSWSPLFADFDNDGYKDLYVTNGIPRDITDNDFIKFRDTELRGNYHLPTLSRKLMSMIEQLPEVKKSNFMFRNEGGLSFADATLRWGLAVPSFSNGAAYADLDSDGDLDLVVNNINDKAFLFRNNSNSNRFLKVGFEGPQGNMQGYGAKVFIETNAGNQYAELFPVRGFQSCMDQVVHFGLANSDTVTSVEVMWPDGHWERKVRVPVGTSLRFRYRDANRPPKSNSIDRSLFAQVTDPALSAYRHVENPFSDFKHEPLLLQMYSRNGPGVAVGDANGDGLDDIVVGGPMKTSTSLFLQSSSGAFAQKEFNLDPAFEDLGMLLFDADNDGANDLYIASGGAEFNANTEPYQDRLYRNDGKGNFERMKDALPKMWTSTSIVSGCDFDRDGDVDLFVGGRVSPGNFPVPPQSYLIRNEHGKFTDITHSHAPWLKEAGMITGAIWTDFDDDSDFDLIVCGEWMPITFLENKDGQLRPLPDALPGNSRGWWNSIAGGDLDNDGDTDYIVGNHGLNSVFGASAGSGVTVYASDLDNNGKLDALIGYHLKGEEVPYHSRDAIVDQVPSLKKRFLSYARFASTGMTGLLPPNWKDSPHIVLQATELRTCVIENIGQQRFRMKPLPVEAQVAPVFGIVIRDVDNDVFQDVVLVGNSQAPEFTQGACDGFRGLVLMGDGNLNFSPLSEAKSGFVVGGDGKALATVHIGKNKLSVVAAENSGGLKAFSLPSFDGTQARIQSGEQGALIHFGPRGVRKHEFYLGSGYLSQSSRTFAVPNAAEQIDFYNNKNIVRKLIPKAGKKGKQHQVIHP